MTHGRPSDAGAALSNHFDAGLKRGVQVDQPEFILFPLAQQRKTHPCQPCEAVAISPLSPSPWNGTPLP
jgi:hypothetical protein